MEQQLLMRRLDTAFHDGVSGVTFTIYVQANPQRDRTWEAFLEFRDPYGAINHRTGIETTQADIQGVVDWATGLTDAYFEGAFARATRTLAGAEAIGLRAVGHETTSIEPARASG